MVKILSSANEGEIMKRFASILLIAGAALCLSGCLASTTSPVGVNCDFSQEKPLWEMPVACQGR
ncbi:hypothetical protein DCO17_10190 [Polynucleobacter tropicus]|uniref:Uncharacterized protein n=2 Tax=Polynucleobacter tropicus TaxID=1743174 RepID=A0A6M9Q7T2_9BURK|nr:hypothetical protein DCO17_10190 [Polynucleobacter tropicus]